MDKAAKPVWKPQRRRKMAALGDITNKLTTPAMRRYGFAHGALIAEWPTIAGPTYARMSSPVKLSFAPDKRIGGTLTLAVDGPAALQIQHVADLIIAAVNRFFGYKAVERLRLVQTSLPQMSPYPIARHKTTEAPPALLAALLAGIPPDLPEGPLRAALSSLATTFSVDKQS